MCSPLLFKVFLRPSFGACAPPSPNSARNLYFLRRVGRLLMIIQASGDLSRRLAPLSPKGKAFYSGASVPLFLKGKAFSQSVKTFCFSDSALESKRQKVFPLGGVYISSELNWGKCRRRDLFLIKLLKAAKSVPTRRTLSWFSVKLGEMPSPRDVVIIRK